eukprot:235486_1
MCSCLMKNVLIGSVQTFCIMKKSSSDSNISSKYRPSNEIGELKLNDLLRSQSASEDDLSSINMVERVNKQFRTDVLLNKKMMAEFHKVQNEQESSRHQAYLTSPRTKYLSQKTEQKSKSKIQDFIKNWDLSQLSHTFLDKSVLVNYNHLILQKLEELNTQKFRIFKITPYILYLFRRLLQIISITLISLFILILYAMSQNSHKINIPSKLDEVPESIESIRDIILDEYLTTLLNETDRVFQRYTESHLEPANNLINRAKYDKDLKIKPKHPVIIFPGICSTSLELWQSNIENDKYINEECKNYIKWNMRQRIWGSAHCITELMRSPKCWLYHMMLNESTGLDPNGIKIRAIEGATGADYLFPGFWVWALVLDNLVTIGYDTNQIYFANFDWRVSPNKLNIRDAYWDRCKFEIELRVKLTGEKAVLIGHSMGANMIMYFLQWVTSNHPLGGHGGKQWVDQYIDSFIPVGGPLLGAPKIIPMYLFGEALETALLPRPLRSFKEMVMPRPWFSRWVRAVHGGMQLAPIGGELIWGNNTYSVEDKFNDNNGETYGKLVNYIGGDSIYSNCHLTETGSIDLDINHDGDIDFHVDFHNNSKVRQAEFPENEKLHAFDFDRICCKTPTEKQEDIINNLANNYTIYNWTEMLRVLDIQTYNHLMENHELSAPTKDINISDDSLYDKPKYFGNPLWRPLPYAPNMTVYCMYGTNLRSGRNYYYQRDYNASFKYAFRINTNYNDKENNIINGFKTVNGDGTIPLLSLGFMCSKGWRNNKRFNPSLMKTKIIEYEDKKESIYQKGTLRGGKWSGDHVDIMGNQLLIKNVLLIAMGYGNNDKYVEEIVNSEIHEMSQLIDI